MAKTDTRIGVALKRCLVALALASAWFGAPQSDSAQAAVRSGSGFRQAATTTEPTLADVHRLLGQFTNGELKVVFGVMREESGFLWLKDALTRFC